MKTVLRSCARRLNALSPAAVDSLVAHDLLGSVEDEAALPRVEEPHSRCPDTSDPSWRQHVHLRKNDRGKSSLEECMAEWDKITEDAHGNGSTLMLRVRIQDVAFHVVHFQESFVSTVGKIDDVTGQHATL